MQIRQIDLEEHNYGLENDLNKAMDELKKAIADRDEMEAEIKIRNGEINNLNNQIKNNESIEIASNEIMLTIQNELDSLLTITSKDKQNLNKLSSKLISNCSNYTSLIEKFQNSPYMDIINLIKKNFDYCIDLVGKLENINHQSFEKLRKAFEILANKNEIATKNNWDEKNSKLTYNNRMAGDSNRNSLINLNINRNININIINQNNQINPLSKYIVDKRKPFRRNSFSHFNNNLLLANSKNMNQKIIIKRNQSYVAAINTKSLFHSDSLRFKIQPTQPQQLQQTHCSQFNQTHSRNHSQNNSISNLNKSISNNNKNVIMSEEQEEILKYKETILELTENIYKLEKDVQDLKLVIKEKDEKINLSEIMVKHFEENIFEHSKQLEDEKTLFLKDLQQKDKKLLELNEKYVDLEELNFKLVHFNKDTKKFAAMEKQIKDLTSIIQNVSLRLIKFCVILKEF